VKSILCLLLKKHIKFSCILPEKGPSEPPAAFQLPKALFQFPGDGFGISGLSFSAKEVEEMRDKLSCRAYVVCLKKQL